MKHDIVYIVRAGTNRELVYSLRTVERNFPHRKVWLYGGMPKGIKPDEAIIIQQQGETKWEKVRNTLLECCKNDNITEDFWLFNDDFFIMEPVTEPTNYYDGTLEQRIEAIEQASRGIGNQYSQKLRHLLDTLKKAGIEEPLNYAHHTPILINRKKMLETLEKYPNEPMFRALYGNINHIGGENMPDVKFHQNRQPYPIGQYASTSDESWNQDEIGRIIRQKFPDPSKWEQ